MHFRAYCGCGAADAGISLSLSRSNIAVSKEALSITRTGGAGIRNVEIVRRMSPTLPPRWPQVAFWEAPLGSRANRRLVGSRPAAGRASYESRTTRSEPEKRYAVREDLCAIGGAKGISRQESGATTQAVRFRFGVVSSDVSSPLIPEHRPNLSF